MFRKMLLLSMMLCGFILTGKAQVTNTEIQTIKSVVLDQEREIWISLPADYSEKEQYPVMYVLDAEYHFNLVSALVNNLSKTKKIPKHIVVGVPHVSIKKERVKDFTYSLSELNPYGDKVLPPFFNKRSCGGAHNFSEFLCKELVPFIDNMYSSSNNNVLIAHSLAGYFATGLLVHEHRFKAIQLYDPSNWYADGEAGVMVKEGNINTSLESLFVAHQKYPAYFYTKLQELDAILIEKELPVYKLSVFENENHGSVFLPAFLEGMEFLYSEYKAEHFQLTKKPPYKK